MRKVKVIHVHLIWKRKDFYFGSIAAIETTLNKEDIGVSIAYLQHCLKENGVFTSDRAIIRQSYLISCRQGDSE